MTPIKPQISFASVIGLGYNTFLLYPRPIILAKRYLCRPERGPEIPEILKSVLKCPEIH